RPAAALDGARAAVALATGWEDDVMSAPVDATGADLSRLGILEPDVLANVVWTDTTRWPARLEPLVRARSNRLAAGVYRVRRNCR
ncbi:hypothetical protein, partial [Streptomyces sp. SID3343]|uniref:hypothetical protein n=1 Tax=Streptomyces sp. SID3343 TaxID=2690260 RepID=UPI0013703740